MAIHWKGMVRGKPHIHLMLTRKWRCSNYAVSGAISGSGDTPEEAYKDWEIRWRDWREYSNTSVAGGQQYT